MTTGQYLRHSIFYFVRLLLLLALIYALLYATGYTPVSARNFMSEMFDATYKGWIMLGALLLWSAIYPKVGFVSRTVGADIVRDREAILCAFVQSGYALASETPGAGMTFRASSAIKRLWMAFGDKITVTADGNNIILSGVRKETVQVQFRIETAIRRDL